MHKKKKAIWILMLVLFSLLLACQCQLPGGLALSGDPTTSGFQPGDCQSGTTRLLMDDSLSGSIAGGDVFEETIAMYCLWVPEGGSELVIGIQDFSADLDIYVSESYDTLMSSTEFGEYYSNGGSDGVAEQVTIPNPAGRYYIQVVSYYFDTSDNFTLWNTFTP